MGKLDISLPNLTRRDLRSLAISQGDYLAFVLSLVAIFGYYSFGKFWFKPDPNLKKLYERPQEEFGVFSEYTGPRDIARQLLAQNQDAVIFWGSQSGTAESFAYRLARDCARQFNLNVIVADLSDYDHDTISSIPDTKFALFLLSTFGEGDPSDNTCDFMTWLKKRQGSLSSLRYAAFGLGNSNYVYYNKVVTDVVGYLDKLKAVSLLPFGMADDADSTTEEDFISWRDDLFAMFQSRLGFEEQVTEYTPTMDVIEIRPSSNDLPRSGEPVPLRLSRKAARDYSAIKKLPVKEISSLSGSDCADRICLHLEVDIRDAPQVKYKTGDHLAVWPINSADEVNRMLSVLGLASRRDVEVKIQAKRREDAVKVPAHSTIGALFEHYLEIGAPVSRDIVNSLHQLAPTEAIRQYLKSLSQKTSYAAFIAQNHVTFARLLESTLVRDPSTNWSQLPLSFVVESLRPMTPRYYSISSSSITSSRQMSITVAVSRSQLPANPAVAVPGLTTSYLADLDRVEPPGIYAHVRRSAFKMPFLHKTPVVLVAAGTGIAPFRAFLQERAQMAQISNQEIGSVVLVFGCRNPDSDYLYQKEIEDIQAGPLKGKLDIVTAFSRVPGQRKVYVQDRLAEPDIQERIRRMLCEDEATLYFCGSTLMAKAAAKEIVRSVQEYEKHDEVESKAWLDSMKRSRRWQEDVWG